MSSSLKRPERILYCHCAYAKVVKPAVKAAVLRDLGNTGRDFDAVPDLCEMSARKDPALARIAAEKDLCIVACFPRAVEWLFHASGNALPGKTPILNMRTETPEDIAACLAGEREMPDPNAASDEPEADHAEAEHADEKLGESAR
ncbi:MAG: hypothetical protein ACI82F_004618 [Planctomycetota bacterium]|jgi:hypothetical protein